MLNSALREKQKVSRLCIFSDSFRQQIFNTQLVSLNRFIMMGSGILDFSTNIELANGVSIDNVTILDEGIQESFPTSSNEFQTNTEITNNAPSVIKGMQRNIQQLSNKPMCQEEIIQNATIIDEGIQESFCSPTTTNLTPAEMIKNATIIDEGIKLCPLCRNELRLFFINFNEKVLMCENFECDYPFGHDEIIYVKENNSIQSDEEVVSIRSKPTQGSPTATGSVISTVAWLDIDKINKINDTEGQNDVKSETREYYKHKKPAVTKEKRTKKIEDNPKILKEVEAIAKMHIELKKVDDRCIKNEKWIKNLMNMQQSSGMSLLKPEEINMFKQKRPELGLGELKIDINPGSQQNMSLIKIELANTDSDKRADVMKI